MTDSNPINNEKTKIQSFQKPKPVIIQNFNRRAKHSIAHRYKKIFVLLLLKIILTK